MTFRYLLAAASLLLNSCDNESIKPRATAMEYLHASPGNYWIYNWFELKPDGTEIPLGRRDSVYISKDTLINGNRAFIKRGTLLGNLPVRKWIIYDSANSLYTTDGEMIFTLDENISFTSHIPDEDNAIAVAEYALKDGDMEILVPAGNFVCRNFHGVIDFITPASGTRTVDNFYSRGTGLIKMTAFNLSSPTQLEMRLVRHGKK